MQKNIWKALEEDEYISCIYRGCKLLGTKCQGRWVLAISGRRVLLEEIEDILKEFFPPHVQMALTFPVRDNYYFLKEV